MPPVHAQRWRSQSSYRRVIIATVVAVAACLASSAGPAASFQFRPNVIVGAYRHRCFSPRPLLPSKPLLVRASLPTPDGTFSESADSLIASARHSLDQNDTDAAFALLARAHGVNANAPGLLPAFEDVLRTRIRLYDEAIDRLGLGSLLLERECFGEAVVEFQAALQNGDDLDGPSKDRAASSLFRARAAICDWKDYDRDSSALVQAVRSSLESNQLPSVHPYEALMWPCLSIQDAGRIGAQYGGRAMTAVDANLPLPSLSPRGSRLQSTGRIRVGYLSNDFTGRHPLGYLMQDVFRFHDAAKYDVFVYSLMEYDNSPEIKKIRQAATGGWRDLLGSAYDAAEVIRADELDVLVDMTIYNGPSVEAEILAHRTAPIQISHEGFPATCGSPPLIDYLVCDDITVPQLLRQYYSESLLYMPHTFFANSHRFLPTQSDDEDDLPSRSAHGLPENGFVFCAHHRSDKIDPITFRSWLRALKRAPSSYLWVMRACDEMESNLRTIAAEEFGLESSRLIFCDKVPRDEHLRRLRLANLFLDTPAYNAHTTGCDSLVVGVPMVSLLRPVPSLNGEVGTDKMPSRVGGSFLKILDLDELIAPCMASYEDIMVKCATDHKWFTDITERLKVNRRTSPLFDTQRWVRNWELGLLEAVTKEAVSDIYVLEE